MSRSIPFLICFLLSFMVSSAHSGEDPLYPTMNGWRMPEEGRTVVWHIETIKQINARYRVFKEQRGETVPTDVKIGAFKIELGGVCHIWAPALNEQWQVNLIRHEVRHCVEGAWHG